MSTQLFTPAKLIGIGCFSLVYSVVSENEHDKGRVYALKRFSIRRPIALLCAVNECKILKRLALEEDAPPYLPKLFYCFRIHESPILVLKEESEITLGSLMFEFDRLCESEARFYLSEIICGLRYLHALDIVHLDLKVNNILLSESGHIVISDFDRSYDFTARAEHPTKRDFFATAYFMAPEIARKQVLSDKADVWSLGIIGSQLIGDTYRPYSDDMELRLKMAKKGYWRPTCFSRISQEFREFLQACFTIPYVLRPNVAGIQNLSFFKDLNWSEVQALQTVPPLLPAEVAASITQQIRQYDPHDPLILTSLYAKGYPVIGSDTFQFEVDESGNRSLVMEMTNMDDFNLIGYTPPMVTAAFNVFDFINPSLTSRLSVMHSDAGT